MRKLRLIAGAIVAIAAFVPAMTALFTWQAWRVQARADKQHDLLMMHEWWLPDA